MISHGSHSARAAPTAARVVHQGNTFIRVVEVWLPDKTGSMLEYGGGVHASAPHFGGLSRTMVFGRGEGLPGDAWERGHPIMLTAFAGSSFRRTAAARAEGLTCGVAWPIFAGRRLRAVLVMFCGDDSQHAGAIELWHNDAGKSQDMRLGDGYYGHTAEAFEFMSRHTSFRRGFGLPGLVWESGLPLFMADFGKGSRFLRADGAVRVGINRAFALPCETPGRDHHVLAFLSALATPIVRRFETWRPDRGGASLQREGGYCEHEGVLTGPATPEGLLRGQGALGSAWAQGVPCVATRLAGEPGITPAPAAGLVSMVAVPIHRDGVVVACAAWYF